MCFVVSWVIFTAKAQRSRRGAKKRWIFWVEAKRGVAEIGEIGEEDAEGDGVEEGSRKGAKAQRKRRIFVEDRPFKKLCGFAALREAFLS